MAKASVSFVVLVLVATVLMLSLVPDAWAQSARTVTIHNQCSTQYWFLQTSGAAPYNPPTLTQCNSNADCITGSYCLLPAPKICFWNTASSSSGTMAVASGSAVTLTYPYVNNGNDIHWSGNIGFCQSGTCGPFAASDTATNCNTKGCGVYAAPGNTFEITMSKAGTDYYDISNIAGVNVPFSVSPQLTTATYSSSVPYTCGAPGSTGGSYPSSWNFTPPSVYYVWTTASGGSCSSDSNCSGGQVCGLSSVVGRSPQLQLQCGTKLGYWTANAVCAQQPSFGAPFNCQSTLGAPNAGVTQDTLDRCSNGLGSCYQPGASTACCGCANWNNVLGTSYVPASTQQCVNTNPNWSTYVLPKLQWLKQGAPNSYTFPYDDMSSTFTCSQKSNGYNHINYDIYLCPTGGGGGGVAIGAGGPYMSTTAPPSQNLPQCGAGNTAYYGTGTESVTAVRFPNTSPYTGSWTVQVNYNNAATRYVHVDLCTTAWNCFTTTNTGPVGAGTGTVYLTLNTNNAPQGQQYYYSVWTTSDVDQGAAQPWLYKHAWQVYNAAMGTSIVNQSC